MRKSGYINRKKVTAYGICLTLALGLAACGQTAEQDGTGTDSAAEETGQTAADADSTGNENGQNGLAEGNELAAAVDGIAYQVNTDISGLDESHRISDTLFGLFLEDINYAVDGGMYAELVKNRSFEYGMEARDAQLHGWEVTGEAVEFSVKDGSADGTALNENNPQYAVVHNTGTSSAKPHEGIRNGGFVEGMSIVQEASYNLSFYCKSEDRKSVV